MKNKSFLNKLEELKSKTPAHLEVEKKLLPRLKFMGYLMFGLCLVSFVFALTVNEETPFNSETTAPIPSEIEATAPFLTEDELTPTAVLNFYVISLVFAVVGASCFLIAWKKAKTLFPQVSEE
jgi:hypothetical protein